MAILRVMRVEHHVLCYVDTSDACMCVVCLCVCGPVTPPAQRVQFLLGRDEECEDEDHQAHAMFCEMEELRPSGEEGEKEWKEIAR